MSTAAAPFDVARFEIEREALGLALGAPLSWRASTGSTNDDALAAARAGAAGGALFGAETQSLGRGRRGSAWLSAPGAGLWFSVLLRPALSAELAPGLALCAGLAVREAVARRVSARALVKWPNDVLAGDRKIAGVLVESQVSGARLSAAVVGVGLNVALTDLPEELAALATSLALLGATDLSRERLLADVLHALALRVGRLEQHGLEPIISELRHYDALLGEALTVDEQSGVGAGIDDAGRLLLRLESGQLAACVSGHVERRA